MLCSCARWNSDGNIVDYAQAFYNSCEQTSSAIAKAPICDLLRDRAPGPFEYNQMKIGAAPTDGAGRRRAVLDGWPDWEAKWRREPDKSAESSYFHIPEHSQ